MTLKKTKYIPVQSKVVEPSLYTMVLLVDGTRYLKNEVAHSLEDAVQKVTINIGGKYYTPNMSSVDY